MGLIRELIMRTSWSKSSCVIECTKNRFTVKGGPSKEDFKSLETARSIECTLAEVFTAIAEEHNLRPEPFVAKVSPRASGAGVSVVLVTGVEATAKRRREEGREEREERGERMVQEERHTNKKLKVSFLELTGDPAQLLSVVQRTADEALRTWADFGEDDGDADEVVLDKFAPFKFHIHVQGAKCQSEWPELSSALERFIRSKIVDTVKLSLIGNPVRATKYTISITDPECATATMSMSVASTKPEYLILCTRNLQKLNSASNGDAIGVTSEGEFFRAAKGRMCHAPKVKLLTLPRRYRKDNLCVCGGFACYSDKNKHLNEAVVLDPRGNHYASIEIQAHLSSINLHRTQSGELLLVVSGGSETLFILVEPSNSQAVFRYDGCVSETAYSDAGILMLDRERQAVVFVAKECGNWSVSRTLSPRHPNKSGEEREGGGDGGEEGRDERELLEHVACGPRYFCVTTRSALLFLDRATGEFSHFTNFPGTQSVVAFGQDWIVATGKSVMHWRFP